MIRPKILRKNRGEKTDINHHEKSKKALTPRKIYWLKFCENRTALLGLIGLILLILFILLGTILVPETQANQTVLANRIQPPSVSHWFGTDNTGRDQFARIIYGGQITIVIGVLAVFLQIGIGTIIGGLAAYYGGLIDSILMRFTESMLSIPSLLLLIVIGKYFGRDIQTLHIFGRTFSGSVPVVVLVIGATSWMYVARIVRAEVLSLKEREFIQAATVLGAKNFRILFYHLIPNAGGSLIVATTLGLANAVIMEAYVSFLGLGVQPPTATWGNMMTQSISYIQAGLWWMWIIPGFFIVYTILCFNLVGDGLRDAFDPHTRESYI